MEYAFYCFINQALFNYSLGFQPLKTIARDILTIVFLYWGLVLSF